jgi:hypothetical protein
MNEKFESEIGKVGRRSWFFSEDDDYKLARMHMRNFAERIVKDLSQSNVPLNILEVGPSENVYKECCNEFSTAIIGIESKKLGHNYKTLDVVGNADYICSVEEVSKHITDIKFDVLVLLGIIEHVGNIHLLCEEFANITKEKAKVYVNTPYMFKVHGPIPDYWRISEYGYRHLFENRFDLEFDVFPPSELGKNSIPLSFNVTLTKK